MATDPATGLPTAPTRVENPVHDDVSICKEFWDREFLQEDVNLFRDLSRATIPAAPLRGSTRDRPARSIRYREFLRPFGWDDELRAVLRIAGSSWGYVSIWRSEGRPPSDAAEVELVASLSTPLAQAIRTHAQAPAVPAVGVGQEPGLMLFTADGELISLNDAARGWLDELRAKAAASAPGLAPVGELGFSKEFDVHLPPVVIGTLTHARAIAQEREHGVARARLRSEATGQWLVCHASSLRDADGKPGDITLVIEPAKAAEIAPIIIQAYELCLREQQITQFIAQGTSTAEIAGRLCLSAHTVRDYIKTIFEKVGVSSRGELVAKLFADHYAPTHFDPANTDRWPP